MSYRSVKSIKANCDRLWSKLVRSAGRCERCGVEPERARGFHPHHVYGRANHRLRWEPRNGVPLCAACHRWAHNNPLDFIEWFYAHRLDDYYWLRGENQKGLVRRTMQDYLDLEEQLKNRLDKGAWSENT